MTFIDVNTKLICELNKNHDFFEDFHDFESQNR